MTDSNFNGFTKSLPDFLVALTQNNNRDWFEANRQAYQKHYVEPALAFIDSLAPIVAEMPLQLKAEARLNGSLRRINRDVRFSKDKSPYNPRLHLIFWAGSHPNRSPAFHLVISAKHVGVGAGQWGFSKEQLQRYRDCLCSPKKLSVLTAALEKADEDNQIMGEPDLKKIPTTHANPAALSKNSHLEKLLRYKGVVVRTRDEDFKESLFSSKCLSYIEKRIQASMDVNQWLIDNIN